jgi:hypothetical protein
MGRFFLFEVPVFIGSGNKNVFAVVNCGDFVVLGILDQVHPTVCFRASELFATRVLTYTSKIFEQG